MGLKKMDIQILGWEITRTPRNAIFILRCMGFLGCECSDLMVGGWVSRNLNIVGFVNPYRILDDPLIKCQTKSFEFSYTLKSSLHSVSRMAAINKQ